MAQVTRQAEGPDRPTLTRQPQNGGNIPTAVPERELTSTIHRNLQLGVVLRQKHPTDNNGQKIQTLQKQQQQCRWSVTRHLEMQNEGHAITQLPESLVTKRRTASRAAKGGRTASSPETLAALWERLVVPNKLAHTYHVAQQFHRSVWCAPTVRPCSHEDLHTFLTAFVTAAQIGKQPSCPASERMNQGARPNSRHRGDEPRGDGKASMMLIG